MATTTHSAIKASAAKASAAKASASTKKAAARPAAAARKATTVTPATSTHVTSTDSSSTHVDPPAPTVEAKAKHDVVDELRTAIAIESAEPEIGGAILENGDILSHENLVKAIRDPEIIISRSTYGTSLTPGGATEIISVQRILGPDEEPEPGDQLLSADPVIVVRKMYVPKDEQLGTDNPELVS